jgi:hypothetical protein
VRNSPAGQVASASAVLLVGTVMSAWTFCVVCPLRPLVPATDFAQMAYAENFNGVALKLIGSTSHVVPFKGASTWTRQSVDAPLTR